MDEVYQATHAGDTLVLRGLQESWPPLSPLVLQLQELFGSRVQVNLYLTGEGSQAFPLHIDYHDFFILQIFGSKQWQLHERAYQPVERLEYEKCLSYPARKPLDQLPLLESLVLSAGDVLYVPRGMPHRATAIGGASLHLTVSLHPLYWMDVLRAAVEQATLEEPALQGALPAGFESDPTAAASLAGRFGVALQSFLAKVSFPKALAAVARQKITEHALPPDGHFHELAELGSLSLATWLMRRRGVLCRVEEEAGRASIRFGKSNIQGPAHLAPAFEHIRIHGVFQVAELPALDDSSKLVLCRRLVREGLLRRHDEGSGAG